MRFSIGVGAGPLRATQNIGVPRVPDTSQQAQAWREMTDSNRRFIQKVDARAEQKMLHPETRIDGLMEKYLFGLALGAVGAFLGVGSWMVGVSPLASWAWLIIAGGPGVALMVCSLVLMCVEVPRAHRARRAWRTDGCPPLTLAQPVCNHPHCVPRDGGVQQDCWEELDRRWLR